MNESNGFDQTNGRVDGLEGDEEAARENADRDRDRMLHGDPLDPLAPIVPVVPGIPVIPVVGEEPEDSGLTAEDRDPAITPYSEDGAR